MPSHIRSSSVSNGRNVAGSSSGRHSGHQSQYDESAFPTPRRNTSSPSIHQVIRPHGPVRRASNVLPIRSSTSNELHTYVSNHNPILSDSPKNILTFKPSFYDAVDCTIMDRPGALEPSWSDSISPNSLLRDKNDKSRETSVASSVTTSINEDVILDVLPSFEMYNCLHRNIPHGNVNPDIRDFPPNYYDLETELNGRNSMSLISEDGEEMPYTRIVMANSFRSSESIINDVESLATRYTGSDHSRLFPHPVDENNLPIHIEDDISETNNISVDDLYSLPKVSSPINVIINVTKHVSIPPNKPEGEFALKEYTSGDTIHGYCIIENKSSKPIRFEMVYVAFEGYITTIDKNKNTRTIKRFLRMVDLSASWSYMNIEMGTGLRYKCRGRDFDDSILGLNHNRILEPGIKYKKFFVFKLPSQLLDTSCK